VKSLFTKNIIKILHFHPRNLNSGYQGNLGFLINFIFEYLIERKTMADQNRKLVAGSNLECH